MKIKRSPSHTPDLSLWLSMWVKFSIMFCCTERGFVAVVQLKLSGLGIEGIAYHLTTLPLFLWLKYSFGKHFWKVLKIVALLLSRWPDSVAADPILEAESAPSVQTTCLETPCGAASVSHICFCHDCWGDTDLRDFVRDFNFSSLSSHLRNRLNSKLTMRIYSGKMIQTKYKYLWVALKYTSNDLVTFHNSCPLFSFPACQCDPEGTLPEGCNKQTGACLCRPGVTGSRCSSCSRGRCDSFPMCESCPSCFFTLDSQRQNLSLALKNISPRLPTTPDSSSVNFGPRILALENRLKLMRESISFPPRTARQVDDALSQLEELRWGLASLRNANVFNILVVSKYKELSLYSRKSLYNARFYETLYI